MEPVDSMRTLLHSKLNEFSTLTRQLLESLFVEKTASATEGRTVNMTAVLERLIQEDRNLHQLVDTAVQMRARQRQVDQVNAQLERRLQEIEDIQNRLHDVEKLLEFTVHHGQQKLESIKQADKSSVSSEELIKYAHRISQASSAVSPVGWQPSDLRRPYPQDIEMRSGALGRLNNVLPPATNEVNKEIPLASVSQSNKMASLHSHLADSSLPKTDTMSEDSSDSSSDEDN